MKTIYVCSPLRPISTDLEMAKAELNRNMERAENTCRWLSQNGFMPLAPHLYFTRFLDDGDARERTLGIDLGMKWLEQADELWCVGDRISEGMQAEIDLATRLGIPVYYVAEPQAGIIQETNPCDMSINML